MRPRAELRALLLCAAVALSAFAHDGPYRVLKVSDGDTIAVRQGSRRVLVRLIGIDAPEIEGPYRRRERGGDEARRELERLLSGRSVSLARDPLQPARDEHGRLLAYVYRTGDSLFVNQEMIRRGFARAYRKFRHTHRERFLRDEEEARRARRGLWNGGTP